MTIHFTKEGIYANTEEERLSFYDRLFAGDPIIWGHLTIYERELRLAGEDLMNGQEEAILRLWNEGMMAENIALKLGIDEETVSGVIEAPGNYLTKQELLKVSA